MSTLDNLRKAAKRWLKALRANERDAADRLRRAYPGAPANPGLRDVQHALARERGHESWAALKTSLANESSSDAALETLFRAADIGDDAAVVTILTARPDLVSRRGHLSGHTGLRTALHFGVRHETVVRALLDRGADPDIRDEGDNAMPLHFAAERGDLAIVRLLVEHGADPVGSGTVHELDAVGWATCFDYANHLEVARYLLAHGARHTIVSATAMGDVEAIRQLVRGGADINQRMDRTNHRRTPLHLAIVKKQPLALAALIDLGADLSLEDAAGLTALDQAALNGEQEMAQLLIESGAAITFPAAIALERTADIERLLRESPDLLVENRRWARLVVRASSQSPAHVMEALLRTAMRHRAGLTLVNMQDDVETAVDGATGYTPLHSAAFKGNSEAAAVLLKHGANPRVRDGQYCGTPAGWARYAGHAQTAELILEADIDIFDAIDADRADRIEQILDRDPGAIDRPFNAYASCGSREGQWWPEPDATPLQWATKQKKDNAVRALTGRGAGERTREDLQRAERIVRFLQSACWDHHVHGKGDHRMYDRAAQRLLAQDPAITHESLYTAIVCGELEEVERILAARPEAARQPGGSRGWTPMLYLCFTRFTHDRTLRNALAIARLLLDRGANPNDFYMAGDARYSALTGVAGEGEQDSPRQPYAAALFELLLERGAEPFDIQVLYDTHFSGDIRWWLELVYKHTIHTPRGEAWKDPDWKMFDMGGYGSGARFLLETAVKKRDMGLAQWVLDHGATPNAAPARDRRFPKRTLYQEAVLAGLPEMADLFVRHGAAAAPPELTDDEEFVQACFRLDRDRARTLAGQHPEFLRSPTAIFEAARRDRPDTIALLLELGVPVDIADAHNTRALHHAAASGALRAATCLIDRGAEIDAKESHYDATPIGWAAHGDKAEMIDLLSRYSRNIWTLCFRGYVERVREVLDANPALARQIDEEGITPLWWLPDEEDKALEIVELLLAHGADPSLKSKSGGTAAEWALKRGMNAVAARLGASGGRDRAPAPPELQRCETLAADILKAHETGEPEALERVRRYFGRAFEWEQLRNEVRRRLALIAGADPGTTFMHIGDARLLVARDAGYRDWAEFEGALRGTRPAGHSYTIDAKDNTLRPLRILSEQEWEAALATGAERRISAVEANGRVTDRVLERIASLEHVTALNLEGCRHVTDEGVRHLARMPQLQKLTLTGCAITDAGLKVLRSLLELRHFSLTHHRGVSDAGVSHLASCHLLEDVNLLGTPSGDDAIKALTGKPHLCTLLAGRDVTEASLKLLHEFPAFKTWQGREPHYSLLTFQAAPTHLLLQPQTAFSRTALRAMAGLDGLFALNIDAPALRDLDLAPLTDLSNLGWLGYSCDDAAMRQIGAMPRLRMLMCQDTQAGDEGFSALSGSTSIEYIWGRRCHNLTGRGFVALSKMPALRGLAVSCMNVDDGALSALPHFPVLRELMPIQVPDEGFRHIGRCERLEALWCMYCRDTGDAATESIASLRHLNTYYAGRTRITDRTLEILGGIDSLERIELWNCAGVTDAGLPFLAKLPRLREIALHNMPKVTLEGTAAFPARVHVAYAP